MSGWLGSYLQNAVRQWPDRLAFRHLGESLSYADLDARARALAASLVADGVAPGDRVGILMPKCLETPIALHAIWMAGSAFVPLDPGAPPTRLGKVIDACRITHIVGTDTSAKVIERLAEGRTLRVAGTTVRGATDVPNAASEGFTPVEASADDIAYVMFTSGSTGDPKGIVHTHASGQAFATMWARLYNLSPDDVLFCTCPLHFDFSLADFFATPMQGAAVELVGEAHQRFPASLGQLLEESGATIWSTVPFAVTQLAERGAVATRDLSRLRWVIYGGEPMPPDKLAQFRALVPGADISNSYGPAETNQCSVYTVPRDHPIDRPIPIGHPTDHAEFAVDEDGSLLVSGSSLMRGYWERPDLDAAAFEIRDGVRFYRTGDVIAADEDGLWRFVGRADRQVKLRGHRVELDEVERALTAQDGVSEAAAVVSPDGLSMVAFATCTEGAAPDAADLLSGLRAVLPPYAVPAKIVLKPAFLRTGTGKIDRKILKEELA